MGEVRLSKRAERDLKRLDLAAVERIARTLGNLGRDPQPENLDIKALVGCDPWKRARVGTYRILFRQSTVGRRPVLLVERIIHRRDLDKAAQKLK